jgi:hypothetical protein
MNKNGSAFPVFDSASFNSDGTMRTDYGCSDSGMTLKQYAAIKLKVPMSGDAELDKMIRESRRLDLAGYVLAEPWQGARNRDVVFRALDLANILLQEWGSGFAGSEEERNG